MRSILSIFCLILLSGVPLFGAGPDLILSGNYRYYDYDTVEASSLVDLQLTALGGARFDGGGSARFGGYLKGSLPLAQGEALQDSEYLYGELFLPAGKNSVRIDADLYASFNDPLFSRYFEPSWALSFAFSEGSGINIGGWFPSLRYSGSWVYQETGSGDQLSNQIDAGFTLSGGSYRTYRLELRGESRFWLEDMILDASRVETEEQRSDWILSLFGEMKGLAGYFLDWRLQFEGGLQWSNDNRLTSLGVLQEDSSDLGFAELDASLSWSPIREMGIEAGLYGKGNYWISRKAADANGGLTDAALMNLALGGRIDADWTFDDQLYLLLGFSGEVNLSNDPALEGWNLALSAGLEYSF